MTISPPRLRLLCNTEPHARSLQAAVARRSVLDQAKGILILRYRIDAEAALQVLRRWADDFGVSTVVLAETLVQGVCQARPAADADPRLLTHLAAAVGVPAPQASGHAGTCLRRLP